MTSLHLFLSSVIRAAFLTPWPRHYLIKQLNTVRYRGCAACWMWRWRRVWSVVTAWRWISVGIRRFCAAWRPRDHCCTSPSRQRRPFPPPTCPLQMRQPGKDVCNKVKFKNTLILWVGESLVQDSLKNFKKLWRLALDRGVNSLRPFDCLKYVLYFVTLWPWPLTFWPKTLPL